MGSTAAASTNFLMAAICAVVTALFWGTYGPLLQKGHHFMEGGRFRPFICVGIAYLLVAVILPLVMMPAFPQELGKGMLTGWKVSGIVWSIIAGAAGAIGAFGVIMAVNYGGPPSTIYVMPIIFGCAPIVNTVVSMYFNNTFGKISPMFFVGLMLVILGVCVVLYTAPRPQPKGHAKPADAGAAANLPPAKKSTKAELENPYSAPADESNER